ncbi:MAG: hypothetical protein F6J97_08880 [Leptolyngbya sp. SIO4C1]|nr:hypothetical protein [Leptolyngbya sp. SIO4C1]
MRSARKTYRRFETALLLTGAIAIASGMPQKAVLAEQPNNEQLFKQQTIFNPTELMRLH